MSAAHRVVLYARVSTKDKGQEVENQLAQLREFASRQGWTICREYVDRESGTTDDRPEFKAMFRDASQRRFDIVLFWALDRLSREGVLETLQHLNRLTSYGVGYRSFTEQYLDSCGIFKDVVIALAATLAKQESVRRSERAKAAIALRRARGLHVGRKSIKIDLGRLMKLRSEGKTIRQIADALKCSTGLVHKSMSNLSV